jgi:hypothetical protein
MRTEMNRQVVLRARPQGLVTEDCFEVVERPVRAGSGERSRSTLGIDPTPLERERTLSTTSASPSARTGSAS